MVCSLHKGGPAIRLYPPPATTHATGGGMPATIGAKAEGSGTMGVN